MKIRDYINELKIEDGFIYRNCLLFPLTIEGEFDLPLLTLDEAVERSAVKIEELPRSTVERVRITNSADSPLFLMDGEILTEALQTRVINTSLIVDRSQVVEIPVSCVEAGRWFGTTKSFSTGRTCATPSVRRSVLAGMTKTRSFKSDQHEVWHVVGTTLASFRVMSPTSSLYHLYTSPTISSLMPEEEEIKELYNFNGVLCAVDGEMFFDIFSSKELFNKMVRKLIGSYVVEAMGKKGKMDTKKSDVEKFVESIMDSNGEKVDLPTRIGFEIRVSKRDRMGKALIYNEKAVHFNGFSIKH